MPKIKMFSTQRPGRISGRNGKYARQDDAGLAPKIQYGIDERGNTYTINYGDLYEKDTF